ATGAPYLTHFTLNAKIIEDGAQLKADDGSDQILSFIIPKDKTQIIEDWNTMGLKATATCSFKVNNQLVSPEYAFRYDQFYLNQSIYKISFSVFAALTLWVNYIGMAEHYQEEAEKITSSEELKQLEAVITTSSNYIFGSSARRVLFVKKNW